MGRGVSCGGGQSSLGYLFGGGGETSNTAPPAQNDLQAVNDTTPNKPTVTVQPVDKEIPADLQAVNDTTPNKPTVAVQPVDKEIPAGIHGSPTNNYFRADGQNCGNFITDRPSTKVHAAPGGGSSLGYLFGGSSRN